MALSGLHRRTSVTNAGRTSPSRSAERGQISDRSVQSSDNSNPPVVQAAPLVSGVAPVNPGVIVPVSTQITTQGSVTTVTSTASFDNGVIDVSIIPYMRSIDMKFVGEGFRPRRPMYYYFDNTPVDNYILQANEVRLSGNVRFTGHFANNDVVSAGSNSATVIVSRVDPDTNKTVLQVIDVVGQIKAGQTLTGSRRSNTGTVESYIHKSGKATAGGSANITLSLDAASMPNNYWGTDGSNTIFLVAGQGIGLRGNITAFNNVSRVMTINSTWATSPAVNTRYSIGQPRSDFGGTIAGTFVVPAYPSLRFLTGERIFSAMDIWNGDEEDATSVGAYKFVASGLHETTQKVIISATTQIVIPPPAPPTQPPTSPPPPPTLPPVTNPPPKPPPRRVDPVAQTFFVDPIDYPNGMFVTSIDLYFRTKDPYIPVTVQLRPVVNGFPHSYNVYPGGEVSVYPEDVNLSTVPSVTNGAHKTKFEFPAPVFLGPGEHSFVVLSSSLEYELYVAELGEKIIGTDRVVSAQPYIGSMFKSQNASTWTPIQLEDVMFVINRASFVPTGQVQLINERPTSPIAADQIYCHIDDLLLSNTNIAYTQSVDSGGSFAAFTPDTTFLPGSRVTIGSASDGTYRVRAQLRTSDSAVSPMIYSEACNMIATENYINNANLSNLDITISVAGNGYGNSSNNTMTIQGGGADITATGYALANATGAITTILITDGGENYINTANILITSNSTTINAVAIMSGEDSKSGGPAIAKYISRIVTLTDGFNAGDLRAFITAYKPQGTDIKMYYKVRNSLDPEKFDDKPWTMMPQRTPSYAFSASFEDTIEYEFRPSLTDEFLQYSSQGNTYKTFNQFAIKITMLSENTVKYPVIYDLRAIALPSAVVE